MLKWKQKKKKEYAPRLYSLSDIQSQANKLYKVSPATTLKIVQTLYEKKISLVSTNGLSLHYASRICLLEKKILKAIVSVPVWKLKTHKTMQQNVMLMLQKFRNITRLSQQKKIPTAAALAKLGPMEQRLYHLILRRTLAIFAQPYIYDETIILTDVNTQIFKTTGRMIRQLGWKEIIGAAKKKNR